MDRARLRRDRRLARPHRPVRRRPRAGQLARAARARRQALRPLPAAAPGGHADDGARLEGRFPSQPGRSRRDEKKGYKASQQFLKGLKPPKASAAVAHVAGRLPARGGSFHFAIRGAGNTASLFSAPQLGFSIPELFVEFEVHAPGLDVRGVTGPGIPVIAAGHNGRIAWGVTSGLGDDDDLYVEKLAGKERYRFKGKTRKMACRNETFKVSGAKSVKRRFCRTVHGPVQLTQGKPRLRAPLRDLGPRDADARRARRAQRARARCRRPAAPRRS